MAYKKMTSAIVYSAIAGPVINVIDNINNIAIVPRMFDGTNNQIRISKDDRRITWFTLAPTEYSFVSEIIDTTSDYRSFFTYILECMYKYIASLTHDNLVYDDIARIFVGDNESLQWEVLVLDIVAIKQ